MTASIQIIAPRWLNSISLFTCLLEFLQLCQEPEKYGALSLGEARHNNNRSRKSGGQTSTGTSNGSLAILEIRYVSLPDAAAKKEGNILGSLDWWVLRWITSGLKRLLCLLLAAGGDRRIVGRNMRIKEESNLHHRHEDETRPRRAEERQWRARSRGEEADSSRRANKSSDKGKVMLQAVRTWTLLWQNRRSGNTAAGRVWVRVQPCTVRCKNNQVLCFMAYKLIKLSRIRLINY